MGGLELGCVHKTFPEVRNQGFFLAVVTSAFSKMDPVCISKQTNS